eukprot:Cvel_11432.t1-p1 / transcript=Cvel_11432.t1 / gene=Cvel_11432 / organism=Chromera_velia_CCMP2878 / gene_product=hypothetical protein / transcript_product=hypothetical protein / location=Cvel_scaffold718:66272-71165(+) / protein_length=376 / sequence_SO=supercontig / SO=protein_coding / is_pseudo=false
MIANVQRKKKRKGDTMKSVQSVEGQKRTKRGGEKESDESDDEGEEEEEREALEGEGGRDVEGSKEDEEEEWGDGDEEEEEDKEEWPRLPNRFPMPVPHLAADSIVASDVSIPWKDADILIAAENGTIRVEEYEWIMEEETPTNSSSLSEAVAAIAKSTEVLLALTVAQQQSSGTAVSSTLSAAPVLPAPSASHKFAKWECKLKYEDRSYAGRLKIVSSFEDHLKQQPSAAPKVVASAFRSGLESFPDLHNLVAELPAPYRDSYEYLKTKILKASGEKEEKRLLDAFHSLATLSSSQHADAEQFGNAVETACQRMATLSLREERVCVYKGTGDPDDDANWKVVRQQVPLLDPLGRRDGQLASLLLLNGISDPEVRAQ